MVLFSEAETLLLLDMYAFLRRQRARNVTAGGLLLRQHARRRLARAMNRRCAREPPWTEAQLAVKVKNLRGEYAELRWLARQPGFDPAGAGLSAAWWAAVKDRRPKAHAFKGKLPWPFERRVAALVGDLPPAARVGPPAADERAIAQLMDELEAEELAADPAAAPHAARRQQHEDGEKEEEMREEEASGEAEQQAVDRAEQHARENQAPDQRRRLEAALAVASIDRAAAGTTSAPPTSPPPPPSLASRKRAREQQEQLVQQEQEQERERERDGAARRSERLAGAVQQSSAAAAGMARGLQELVGALQEQSARYGRLAAGGDAAAAEHQRRVVLSVARALEQSTRAAADMALGFHDLVRLLVRERAAEGE